MQASQVSWKKIPVSAVLTLDQKRDEMKKNKIKVFCIHMPEVLSSHDKFDAAFSSGNQVQLRRPLTPSLENLDRVKQNYIQ